jgi:transcriptional regulator with XRE-family HTH domain
VRVLRQKKGWTQVQLARSVQLHGWDISREQFNRLENQSRQVLAQELLILAKVFGVKMEELFSPGRK